MLDVGTATALMGLEGARQRVLQAGDAIAAGTAPGAGACGPVLETSLASVADYLIRYASREQVRKLLHELGAIVTIGLPHTREEWHTAGATPIAERVTLTVPGTGMVVRAASMTEVPEHAGDGVVVGDITVHLDGEHVLAL